MERSILAKDVQTILNQSDKILDLNVKILELISKTKLSNIINLETINFPKNKESEPIIKL